MPSLVVRPGGAVRLKQQPDHVPDFVVIACIGDRAWIRQPEWPTYAQLCVRLTQLAVPYAQSVQSISQALGNSGGSAPPC